MALLLRSLVIPKILQPLCSQVSVTHKFCTQQPAVIEPAPEDYALSTETFFSEKSHVKTEVPEHLQQYLGNEFEVPEEPILSIKDYLNEDRFYSPPREIWIENMNTIKERKMGMATFHPLVYGHQPRIDVIHENVTWQRKYRWVRYANTLITSEVQGSHKKPWPQKGMGKARHSCKQTPLWGVSKAHGPRSPTVHFYMLPFFNRVAGLASTLSVKFAQDDLHVVDHLEIPTTDPEYLHCMVRERMWGPSVLIVDKGDIFPENIAIATDQIKHINLMPAYGLNVYSMLKHNTLVLTLDAARHIEEKLLHHMNRTDWWKVCKKFRVDQK